MGCEYLIAPVEPGEPPCWPALTAKGFVLWMEQCVLAAPGKEAERLTMVVGELLIEARGFDVGARLGSLPKQFSRHLFPAKPDELLRDGMIMACQAGHFERPRG